MKLNFISGNLPKISNIVPIDFCELVIEFDSSELRIFPSDKSTLYEQYRFLGYPNQLKCFDYTTSAIKWHNGVSIDSRFLYDKSMATSIEKLKFKTLLVGSVNCAATDMDERHHVFGISILPFNIDQPFSLDESIGGGFGERGGSQLYAIEDLLKQTDWKVHFERSGCIWAAAIIEKFQSDHNIVIAAIIKEICHKASLY